MLKVTAWEKDSAGTVIKQNKILIKIRICEKICRDDPDSLRYQCASY